MLTHLTAAIITSITSAGNKITACFVSVPLNHGNSHFRQFRNGELPGNSPKAFTDHPWNCTPMLLYNHISLFVNTRIQYTFYAVYTRKCGKIRCLNKSCCAIVFGIRLLGVSCNTKPRVKRYRIFKMYMNILTANNLQFNKRKLGFHVSIFESCEVHCSYGHQLLQTSGNIELASLKLVTEKYKSTFSLTRRPKRSLHYLLADATWQINEQNCKTRQNSNWSYSFQFFFDEIECACWHLL